jgi:ketosteroid isomerase-like protein
METNAQLITDFYTAFKEKDYQTMQGYYADDAIFNDAVFESLNATQVKLMWQMLLTKGKDLKIEFFQVKANGNKVTAHWDASYTFSATGKKVINKIGAIFEIENGEIVSHTDSFSFYSWAKQAFGTIGVLIGWTSFFKKKIRKQAMKNLRDFIAKNS